MTPKAAASVQVGICKCPMLHVLLRDDEGRVFASACVSLKIGRALGESILSAIDPPGPDLGFSCQAVH